MLIGLCGKSGTGKSTIAKELEKLGYNRVVTDTTRPPRPGEKHGVDYWFDSMDMWNELQNENQFIENTSYKVATGDTWYYGTSIGAIDDAGDKAIIVLNPDGVKAFRNKKIPIKIVLIESDQAILLERLRNRGDKEDELQRRLKADNKDFNDIYKYIDCKVKNNKNSNIEKLAKYIVKMVDK